MKGIKKIDLYGTQDERIFLDINNAKLAQLGIGVRAIVDTLKALGLEKEIERCALKKMRAGRGKSRGRASIRKKGPLIVIGEDKGLAKAASNIPGVDVSTADKLSVSMLAPGTVPGRLAVWTRSAVESIEKLAAG